VYGEYGSFCPSTNEIRLCTDSEQVFLHEMSHTIDEHLENYKIIDYGFGELETAKEMKIKLTDEEVSEVLETVLDSHDAMFGINNVFNMKVITLSSAKGGVAKSASAISISYVLSQLGYKVLLIDTDPQNAVTRHFVNDATQIEHKTLRQLFLKNNIFMIA